MPEKLERKPVQKQTEPELSQEDENAIELQHSMADTSVVSDSEAANSIPENLSDQSKMVMELFNGKYIE